MVTAIQSINITGYGSSIPIIIDIRMIALIVNMWSMNISSVMLPSQSIMRVCNTLLIIPPPIFGPFFSEE